MSIVGNKCENIVFIDNKLPHPRYIDFDASSIGRNLKMCIICVLVIFVFFFNLWRYKTC